MSSVSAQRNNSGVYGATKHAVNVISSSLRDELEEDDIRVTNVLPGATSTNFARNFPPEFVHQFIAASGLDIDFTPGEHLPAESLEAMADNLKKCSASPLTLLQFFTRSASRSMSTLPRLQCVRHGL